MIYERKDGKKIEKKETVNFVLEDEYYVSASTLSKILSTDNSQVKEILGILGDLVKHKDLSFINRSGKDVDYIGYSASDFFEHIKNLKIG